MESTSIAKQGILSSQVHAIIEPLVGAFLVASPFLFGFTDIAGATAVAIVGGIVLMVLSLSTNWKVSFVNVVPLAAHAFVDVVVGLFFIITPFVFSFTDRAAPTALFIVIGILWVLMPLPTRWESNGRLLPQRKSKKTKGVSHRNDSQDAEMPREAPVGEPLTPAAVTTPPVSSPPQQ